MNWPFLKKIMEEIYIVQLKQKVHCILQLQFDAEVESGSWSSTISLNL